MSKNHQSIISIRVAPEGNVTREESSSIQPRTKNGENISIFQPTPDIILDESFSSGSSQNTNYSGLKPIFDGCRKYAIKWINDTLQFEFEQQESACSGFYFLVIAFLVVLPTTVISMVPFYEETKYTWKGMPQVLLKMMVNSILFIFFHHFDFLLLVGKRQASSAKTIFYLFLVYMGVILIIHIISITLHINGLPITSILFSSKGVWSFALRNIVFYSVLWFQQQGHPGRLSGTSYIWFVFYRCSGFFVYIAYIATSELVLQIPTAYQPTLAFVFFAVKHGNMMFCSFVFKKINGEITLITQFVLICGVTCLHAQYLTFIIGSSATFVTTCTLCLGDAALIIRLCFHTIELIKNQENVNTNEITKCLQTIVVKESLEILFPLCFCIILICAYFGPNWEFLRVVEGNKMEDMVSTLVKVGVFMSFDLLRFGVIATFLWRSCKVSLMSSYNQVIPVYWKPIAAYAAIIVFHVRSNTYTHTIRYFVIFLNPIYIFY